MRIFLCLAAGLSFYAGAKEFTTWKKYSKAELVMETGSFAPGAPAAAGLKISMVKGWHTYWLNPGDSGTPVHLKFKTGPGLTIGAVHFPIPQRLVTGPLISFAYEGVLLLPIDVKVGDDAKPGSTSYIDVDAEWLVCEDVCIPASQKVHLDVPISQLEDVKPSDEFALFQQARALVPKPISVFDKLKFHGQEASWQIPSAYSRDEFVDFFPFRGSGLSNVKAQAVEGVLQFEKSSVPPAPDGRLGVMLVRLRDSGKLASFQFGDDGWKFETQTGRAPVPSGLLWMLISAFLGGLILNLMPCVFPILSMKLLSLLKHSGSHHREIRVQNFSYVAGVLVSFLAIAGVLTSLRSAGQFVGWGFQLQSPVFVAFLCWLFFALSLNLLGVYEIDFINAGLGGGLTRLGGVSGSFFTGVLAVVVATPCTAPFMGVALGFGLSQPAAILTAIFFTLGLGLAFPYLVFALFPSVARLLPRPGEWMNVIKKVMAIPLLFTTLWLLWILQQVSGPNAIFVVLAGALVLGVALVWKKSRAIQIGIALILAGGLVAIDRISVSPRPAPVAEDGMWQPYSDAKLASLKGQNVMINMTADWCLTCKVNERLVFDDQEVQDLLKKKSVVLLKGDWTQRNDEITRFLNRYNRVGVPFYVLYSARDPEGHPLPEVLTKSAFMDLINEEYP